MKLSDPVQKVRRMGLRNALRKVIEHCLFSTWNLLWLEREVGLPPETQPRAHSWTYKAITRELLPAFNLHFARHIKVFSDLVDEPGVQGIVALDPQGTACAFLWFSDRDYYDRHYYHCWFPVEPGGVYLFAIETAPVHRGSTLIYGAQEMFWQQLRAAGILRCQAVVNERNALTLKLLRHMGFRRLEWRTRVVILFGSLRLALHPAAVRARIRRQGEQGSQQARCAVRAKPDAEA